MDSETSGTDAPRPRRGVIACLFLVGAVALAFGAWRLAVLGFGRPEQLLDIGDTRTKPLVEQGEAELDRARRDVEAAREDKGATGPQRLAEAEEKLRRQEKSQATLAGAWEAQVGQARRGELAYVLLGLGVGAYGVWAGCRQLRARGR
jgi:hypothetical protein